MYDIKENQANSNYVAAIIFFVIVLFISVIFFFVFYSANIFYDAHAKVKDYTWTYSSNSDSPYSPEVTFRYEGETYTCRPNYSTSDKHKIEYIYFSRSNPNNCMVDLKESVGKFIYLIFAIPGLLLIIALLALFKGISRKRRYSLLKQNGVLVKNIPCTITNLNTNAKGRYYVQIQATYTFPDGTTKKLKQFVLTTKSQRENNTCDLLYLLEDYKVYYLGFDIEYQTYSFKN